MGGFTAEHGCKRLVWFEMHGTMESAILREKQLKNWRCEWKLALIEEANPTWRDLAEEGSTRSSKGSWIPDQVRGDDLSTGRAALGA